MWCKYRSGVVTALCRRVLMKERPLTGDGLVSQYGQADGVILVCRVVTSGALSGWPGCGGWLRTAMRLWGFRRRAMIRWGVSARRVVAKTTSQNTAAVTILRHC